MSALLSYYRVQLRAALGEQLQYRAGLIIWMIFLVLEPVMYLSVWSAVANSSGGVVGGLAPSDFAAYYIAFLIVTHFTQSWDMWEYDYIIRQGMLSGRLLRPIHPIHHDIAHNLVYKFIMLIVVIPAVALMIISFQPSWHPSTWSMLLFVPALFLAAAIAYLFGWALAMLAFWTTRTFAINNMYFVAILFFSGQIAPLALLPQPIQHIAAFLPFRWFRAFPVELLLGQLTPQETLMGFLAQGMWLLLSLLAVRIMWRMGIRHYSAMGG